MATETARPSRIFLSTLTPDAGEKSRATASAAVLLLTFVAILPFARTPLPEVWAFIPSYQSALIACDLITAILLLAQFVILRAGPLLPLALGYLFCALMSMAHALTFPGLFAPGGLLGAQPQTTAWLYMVWHGGFPVAVVGYALLGRSDEASHRLGQRHPHLAIGAGVLVISIIVLVALLVTTAGHDLLPAIMAGHQYTAAMLGTVTAVWLLAWAALAILCLRPQYSILDVWLMVVMVAWIGDVGLSAMFNAGRFDLGFYAGRVFGLCAASFVLIVLLLETMTLYARLADMFDRDSAERDRDLAKLRLDLIHVARLNELGQMVSALSHELNQPLTAASNYLAAGKALLGSDPSRLERMLSRASEQIERAGDVISRIRQLVRKGDIERRPEDLAATVREAATFAMIGAPSCTMRIILDTALPAVLIDKVQIQQVVLNLVRNAVEAMADQPRRELVLGAIPVPDDMVEISIADTGPGLDAAVRERLFQPFVTTKAAGMGVGLSICQSIIELHAGRLWVTENPGGGTVFRFTVQAAEEAAHRSSESLGRRATGAVHNR